jgi:hypothetical protein
VILFQPRSTRRSRRSYKGFSQIPLYVLRFLSCAFFNGLNQPRSTRRARRSYKGGSLTPLNVLRFLSCAFFNGLNQPRSTRRARRSDGVLLILLSVLCALGNCFLHCSNYGRPALIFGTFFSIFNKLARPRSMQDVCISNSQTSLRALRVLRGSFFLNLNQPRSTRRARRSDRVLLTPLCVLRVLCGTFFSIFNLLARPRSMQDVCVSNSQTHLRALRVLRGSYL